MKKIFKSVPYIVDIDDSYRPSAAAAAHLDRSGPARILRRRAERRLRHDPACCSAASTVGYSHRGEDRNPIEIVIGLPKRDLVLDASGSPRRRCRPIVLPGSKTVVELGDVVHVTQEKGSPMIFRRDGHFADMVMAELAGAYEAPIYGMLAVDKRSRTMIGARCRKPPIRFHGQPRGRSQADAAVGRRMGDHLCDLPRHGRGLRRRDSRHLHSRRRRSSAASNCRS